MFARVRADSTTTTGLRGLCGFQDGVRFANVRVGEDARRLGVESTVGELRRDVVGRPGGRLDKLTEHGVEPMTSSGRHRLGGPFGLLPTARDR